jgi:hypothetical protein
MEDELVDVVNAFEGIAAVSDAVKGAVSFLKRCGTKGQAHSRLCTAMIREAEGGNPGVSELLHFAGGAQVLVVVYNNIAHAK